MPNMPIGFAGYPLNDGQKSLHLPLISIVSRFLLLHIFPECNTGAHIFACP